MQKRNCVVFAVILLSCKNKSFELNDLSPQASNIGVKPFVKQRTDTASWAYFLQRLPEKDGPVLNYKGQPVAYQDKHFSIINYDVGNKDLQQCADALMRLRAEYLFGQKRFDDIGFHFVSGQYYRFADYCNGRLPVAKGNDVVFISSAPHEKTRAAFRQYLDLVYNYASTISLAAELKKSNDFTIGTVIIHPGSPGHCFIITDEATSSAGEKLYKLVEGYTPAQSIYVLRNLKDTSLGYWYPLKKGPVETASYEFDSYQLKKFE